MVEGRKKQKSLSLKECLDILKGVDKSTGQQAVKSIISIIFGISNSMLFMIIKDHPKSFLPFKTRH